MTYTELVELYFDRSNALQWYWTLYVVIIGGLLASSSLRQRRDRLTTAIITVLFAFFAYKNEGAIQDTSSQRIAVLQAIDASPIVVEQDATLAKVEQAARDKLRPTLVQPDAGGIRRFHYTCDALTIAALWAMERRRRLMADDAK